MAEGLGVDEEVDIGEDGDEGVARGEGAGEEPQAVKINETRVRVLNNRKRADIAFRC